MHLLRKPRAPSPASADAATDVYRSRYDIARQGYEMRVALLARALDQATLKNYLAAAGNLLLGAGIVVIALRGGVKPLFVPYDRFGRVIQYDDLSRLKDPPRAYVEAELGRWLVNTRGIYFGDPVAQLDRGRLAKAFLAPEADAWLAQYFDSPAHNPKLLLREISRTVEVVSVRKDPDRNLWYLQWREIDVPAHGAYAESAWQGTLKVDFVPRTTEDGVWTNPTGIQIRSIDWNRLTERVGTPAPAPPAGPPASGASPPPTPVAAAAP